MVSGLHGGKRPVEIGLLLREIPLPSEGGGRQQEDLIADGDTMPAFS